MKIKITFTRKDVDALVRESILKKFPDFSWDEDRIEHAQSYSTDYCSVDISTPEPPCEPAPGYMVSIPQAQELVNADPSEEPIF